MDRQAFFEKTLAELPHWERLATKQNHHTPNVHELQTLTFEQVQRQLKIVEPQQQPCMNGTQCVTGKLIRFLQGDGEAFSNKADRCEDNHIAVQMYTEQEWSRQQWNTERRLCYLCSLYAINQFHAHYASRPTHICPFILNSFHVIVDVNGQYKREETLCTAPGTFTGIWKHVRAFNLADYQLREVDGVMQVAERDDVRYFQRGTAENESDSSQEECGSSPVPNLSMSPADDAFLRY